MTRLALSVAAGLFLSSTLAAAPPAVTAAAYHPQGKAVAFGLHGQVRLFDPNTAEPVRQFAAPGRVTAVAFSPRGDWLAVAGGEPGKSGIVHLFAVQPDGPKVEIRAHQDAVYALAFAPDGKTLATAGYDRVIRLWDIPESPAAAVTAPRRELKDHSDTVYGLAFHPDGKLLASGSADRAVKVWHVETGTRLYTLGDPTDWVYCVAWSPDRKHLAAAGVDRSIRVWEADRDGGRLVHAVFAHEQPVWRVAYVADGKTLYSAGEDRVIKAWDTAKMVETRVLPAQPDAVLDLAVRPDGKQLAVARFDGVALLLDSASGKVTAQPLPVKPVAPKAERVSPTGVPRGKTTMVKVTGQNLDQARAVIADVDGITAKLGTTEPERVEVELAVPADAPIGAVRLVFEGEAGKSAPLTLAIDRYPAVTEAGATDSARTAMAVKLPATVAGAIDRPGDVDYFRFAAKTGEQIGVQVVTGGLGSRLDPVLVLTDGSGQVLAEGGNVLGYAIPKAGTYSVGVRDREYRGGTGMTYRLHVGDVPVITGVFPLGVQRGRTAKVHVEGVNLPSRLREPVTVRVPADAAPGSKVPVPLPDAGEKPLGTAVVLAGEFPAVVVDPAGGEVRVPGSADGILARPGDVQTIRFAAKAGERLVVEAFAQRAGSPVDPVIEILDAAGKPVPRATLRATAKTYVTFRDHDSAGPGIRLETWNELAIDDYLFVDGELMRILALPRNPDDDCQFYQVGGQRVAFLDTTPTHHALGSPMYKVEVHPPGRSFPPNGLPVFTLFYRNDDGGPGYGKDSRLFFDAPADGVYQVRVSDARGAGGPTHAYRVTVRPPRPDFTVSFSPSAPAVWKGGGLPVTVTVNRLDGFDGPVHVKLEGLPKGFHAPATFVEGNLTTTAFTLFADADAAVPPDTKLRLVAKATVDGQEVVREAVGGAPRVVEPGDLVTTTRQDAVTIKPGQEARLVVDIERRNKFAGRVPLDVKGLPHGVRVLNIGLNGILITERETSREVILYAEPWVQPTEHPIVVLARREVKNTEHAAKSVLLKVER